MPIDQIGSTPQVSLFDTIGDSGLKGWGGFLSEEFLPELQGQKGRNTYRRMASNDATIGAIIRGITTLVSGVEWTVQAADETPQAEEAKKFVEGVLDDMETPLTDVISEACTMFIYGFAPLEVTYKVRSGRKAKRRSKFDDGMIGLHAMELRAQTSLINWNLDRESGELLGMNQLGTWRGTVYIPRRKLALFRCDSVKQNPESTSILRTAYRSWFFKQRLEEIEAVGAERNNAGVPMIRIPARYLVPSASPDEKRYAKEMEQVGYRLRRDQQDYILAASDTDDKGNRLIDISLVTPSGKTVDVAAMITRYDRAMATSVMMDFLFLGQQSVGSFALSSDKTSLFAQVVGSYTKRMAETFNRDVIGVLWEANDLPPELMPKMVAGDLEKPDLTQLAGYVGALVGSGAQMFPDRELENFLRKAGGLPLLPEDQEGQGADLPDQGLPQDEPPQGAKPQAQQSAGSGRSPGEP